MKGKLKLKYKRPRERDRWEIEAGIPNMTPGERLAVGIDMSDFCLYLGWGRKQGLQRASTLFRKQSPPMQLIWEDEARRFGNYMGFQRCLKLLQAAPR